MAKGDAISKLDAEMINLRAENARLSEIIEEDMAPTIAYIKTVVEGESPITVKLRRIEQALSG